MHPLIGKWILAKITHGHKIRFAPPLVIDESQVLETCSVIKHRNSRVAQRNRAGSITHRCVNRNHALLSFCLSFLRVELIW
ncbi:hypothetical protein T08_9119, partial [Trichinella sp. T8]